MVILNKPTSISNTVLQNQSYIQANGRLPHGAMLAAYKPRSLYSLLYAETRPSFLDWRVRPIQVGYKLGKPDLNRKSRRKMHCAAWHKQQISGPELSTGCVKLSVMFTSATVASWGISVLRKPCWHVTSKPKKTHYSVSCNALYKKDHARNDFCSGLFRHAKGVNVCFRSTLFRSWIAGCCKILLMWKTKLREDQNNEQNVL